MNDLVINENNFHDIIFIEIEKIKFKNPELKNYFLKKVKELDFNNSSNIEKAYILNFAVVLNSVELVKILLESNFEVNQNDIFGRNPLYYSVKSKNFDIIKCLIDKGANINFLFSSLLIGTKSNFLMNLAHLSCREGNTETVELLLDKGLNINSEDGIGLTPLQYAFINQETELAFTLIKRGASTNFRNVVNNKFYVLGLKKLSIMIISNSFDVTSSEIDIKLMSKLNEINNIVNYEPIVRYFNSMLNILSIFINNNTRDNLSHEDYKSYKGRINIFLDECYDSPFAKMKGIDNIYIARNIRQEFNQYLVNPKILKSDAYRSRNFVSLLNSEDKIYSDIDFNL